MDFEHGWYLIADINMRIGHAGMIMNVLGAECVWRGELWRWLSVGEIENMCWWSCFCLSPHLPYFLELGGPLVFEVRLIVDQPGSHMFSQPPSTYSSIVGGQFLVQENRVERFSENC